MDSDTDHQKRLTLNNDIANLVIEADHHARRRRKAIEIRREDVMTALAARRRRNSLLADKLSKSRMAAQSQRQWRGRGLGQVLVYSLESLGSAPHSYHANVWAGRSGIINVKQKQTQR